MATIQLDHFITYLNAPDIDDYRKEYAALGFDASERTVRHDPGLRNGFVFFGPEYIEFCWVEDEALFQAGEEDKLLRSAARPCGIGMITDDLPALHDEWTARGYDLPAVWSKAQRDAPPDSPPAWSFQEIPATLLPGAFCFALTYHSRLAHTPRKIRIAPNTVYAISGITFVTPQPDTRAAAWHDLLVPEAPVTSSSGRYQFSIGPHLATWITPETYQTTYGLPWHPSPHPNGDIGLLHLLASDLSMVHTTLQLAGRHTFTRSVEQQEHLIVPPDARDGFVFAIRQQPVELWLRQRTTQSAELLEIEE